MNRISVGALRSNAQIWDPKNIYTYITVTEEMGLYNKTQ